MILRPCLSCGTPAELSRCPDCAPPKPVVTTTLTGRAAGYDNAWDKLSKRARRLQPFCLSCGSTTDLQCDHTPEAWRRKAAGKPIRLRDVQVLCRDCNVAAGPARGPRVRSEALGGTPSLDPARTVPMRHEDRYTPPGGIR